MVRNRSTKRVGLTTFDCFSDAFEDDPAARYISTRPINHHVASSGSYGLARKWMHDCLVNHENCPKPDSSFTPTRLIDVGKEEEKESAHLTIGQNAPYAALSYCWGGPQSVTLNTLTMDEMRHGIAASALPQTILDAMIVTRRLGLQYLWVDALCIIQDSALDKDAEIANMGEIYENAQLTISAASAEKCQDGFLTTRSMHGDFSPPWSFSRLPFACPNSDSGIVSLRESSLYYTIIEPLNRRALALQERILSPRVLLYGCWQMYWQCQSQRNCDGGSPERIHGNEMGLSVPSSLQTEQTSYRGGTAEDTENALCAGWSDLVHHYTQRGLSDPSDKLPALSGIASKFQKAKNDKYCAGLWKASLLKGLKWQVGEPERDRPSVYRAPTWSWASIFGEAFNTEYKPPTEHSVARSTAILDVHVTPENILAPFGKVSEGTLTIRGVSKTVKWDGGEQIPRADLDPTLMPVSAKGVGSPLFPDGIVALAKPDIAEEELYVESDSGDQSSCEKVVFYMGQDQEGVNKIRRLVVFVVLDGDSALLLEESDDGCYMRLGLIEFKDEDNLEQFFDGWEENDLTRDSPPPTVPLYTKISLPYIIDILSFRPYYSLVGLKA